MVVALGPGKFYGSSLPRPRIYTDVKFNTERVDPPVPVLDPLMTWAQEAHWSMGGLSFKRLRLQGRIEGNVQKLRAEREKVLKKRNSSPNGTFNKHMAGKRRSSPSPPPAPIAAKRRRYMALIDEDDEEEEVEDVLVKEERGRSPVKRGKRPARKLGDDFDRVATESGLNGRSPAKIPPEVQEIAVKVVQTRGQRSKESGNGVDTVKIVEQDVNKSNSKGKRLRRGGRSEGVSEISASSPASESRGTRTSPRLARKGLR